MDNMNNSLDNIIIWQKWVDPFGEDEISEILSSKLDNENNDPQFYDDTIEDDKQENPPINVLKKNIKVITTPMGIVPVTENTASGKIFNFWMGHSNFDITKKLALIIEQTNGVETLDIFTRYRFRIGVGKAFIDSVVMRNINNNVYEHLETSNDTK